MMKGLASLGTGAVIALALALFSLLPAGAQSTAEKLYKTKCAMCHAADGTGSTPAGKRLHLRDLRSSEVQKQTDAQLTEIITKGKKDMPAYEKNLKETQIKGLVAYIREMAKEKKK